MSALYWSYVTSSHVGVGDITAVNTAERTFTIIYMLLSTFTSTYFFGCLAAMVDDLAPLIKRRFDSTYNHVVKALHSAGF